MYSLLSEYKYFLESVKENYSDKPTFHILIATGGRPSLLNLLDSLKNELNHDDAITIVFDGENAKAKSTYNEDWIKDHKSNITVIDQIPNLGYWGHEIRNQYQTKLSVKTTFVLNADDDDVYIEGSFNKLRELCKDSHTLYIAKIITPDGIIIPKYPKIELSNISTQNGIIPIDKTGDGYWAHFYGGDFSYYNDLQKNINVEFIDVCIYKMR